MPTKSTPRRVLIKIAEELYKLYQTAPYDGFTDKDFVLVSSEKFEPGMEPEDCLDALKQIQKGVKSIKVVRFRPNSGPIDVDGKMVPIDISVDPKNFKADLLKFIAGTHNRNRVISRDERGVFWFRETQEMVPKTHDAAYWKTFEAVYEVAMRGSQDENEYFLAAYKPLKKALIERKVISKYECSDQQYRQKLRNVIKDQFMRRPRSFGLPQHQMHGKEILKIEERMGVKLYNPEL